MLAFVACQWGYKVIALATAACLDAAAELDTGEVTVVVKYPTLKDVEALNDYRAVNAAAGAYAGAAIQDGASIADRRRQNASGQMYVGSAVPAPNDLHSQARAKEGQQKGSCEVPANKAALRV
jgi:hypothetical protein